MNQSGLQNRGRLEKHRAAARRWVVRHPEENKEKCKQWREENPEKVKENKQEQSHKGGKYYEQQLKYLKTGIPGEKEVIRKKHQFQYRKYKPVLDPEGLTALHHEWILGTAKYRGVALVEKDQHQHGIIDVIQILEGKITLRTEGEVRGCDDGI